MIINSNNQGVSPAEVDKMVVSRVKKMIGIKATGDIPTDAKQLVNKQYVDRQDASIISVISSSVGVAAGQSGQVQFNSGGSFGASSVFSYGQVSIVGVLTVGGGSVYGRVSAQELYLAPLTSGANAGVSNIYLNNAAANNRGNIRVYGDYVSTTNNTFTSFTNTVVPLVTPYSCYIEARIIGVQVSGAGGTAGDTSVFVAGASYKRNTGGGFAQVGTTSTFVSNENNANTDFQFTSFGSQPLLQVKGDTNCNYDWNVVYTVSYGLGV